MNQEEVASGVKRTIAILDKATGAPDEERYISASVACVLYGAGLAQKLGLLDFDTPRLWPWAIDTIKDARKARIEEFTDAVEILGRYMNEHANERIVLRDANITHDGVIPIHVEPRGELHQRYEMNAQILYIERRHFCNWLIEIHEDYVGIRNQLQQRGVYVGVGRKALASGTGLGSVGVECIKLDLADLANVGVALAEKQPVVITPEKRSDYSLAIS
jgi:hypothetical protein